MSRSRSFRKSKVYLGYASNIWTRSEVEYYQFFCIYVYINNIYFSVSALTKFFNPRYYCNIPSENKNQKSNLNSAASNVVTKYLHQHFALLVFSVRNIGYSNTLTCTLGMLHKIYNPLHMSIRRGGTRRLARRGLLDNKFLQCSQMFRTFEAAEFKIRR